MTQYRLIFSGDDFSYLVNGVHMLVWVWKLSPMIKKTGNALRWEPHLIPMFILSHDEKRAPGCGTAVVELALLSLPVGIDALFLGSDESDEM